MTWEGIGLGLLCLAVGLGLTLVWPIQRGRFRNQLWDVITFALWVGGFYLLRYWDDLSNLIIGVMVGFGAVLIRDARLWFTRFRDQSYRRNHRYYWYGRARNWWGGRRRRY